MSKKKASLPPNKTPKAAVHANKVTAQSNHQGNTPANQPTGNSPQRRPGFGCSLALVIVLVVAGLALAIGGWQLLAFVDQTGVATAAVVDRTSPTVLAERHAQAVAQLESYGWVDQTAGVAHVPVARAIALLADSGLTVGAPAEIASSQPTTTTTADLTNVNFEEHILPIFEQHCAECHGADEPEEGLQLTTYKAALAGSFYGAVIKPGEPENSYLVELVQTGQMPKKGPDLTAAEIETIVAWIKAGAPEKGSAPTDAVAAAPAVDLTNVSFAQDVLPIFVEHCAECHGADEPEEGLVLTSHKDAMAGSFYGKVIKPGAPDESYLVELVATGQMPKRGDDLTKTQVDTIIAWIKAGAPDN